MALRGLIRSFAKSGGYEILGPTRAHAADHSLARLMERERINLVLDVGANAGQFAVGLRENGYRGRIVSFEPLAAVHTLLRKRAAGDSAWIVPDRTAVGSETGSLEINVSGTHASSSLLPMLSSHTHAVSESAYIGRETVPVARLDDLWTGSHSERTLLKIDVQGYEPQVLDGAVRLLSECRALSIEMTLVPLYEGEMLALQLWQRLAAEGFEMWSLEPGFRHPASGRLLQADGIFVRSAK